MQSFCTKKAFESLLHVVSRGVWTRSKTYIADMKMIKIFICIELDESYDFCKQNNSQQVSSATLSAVSVINSNIPVTKSWICKYGKYMQRLGSWKVSMLEDYLSIFLSTSRNWIVELTLFEYVIHSIQT